MSSFFSDPWGFITGKDEIDKEYDNCVKTCESTKDEAKAAKKANAAAPVQTEVAPAAAQSGGRRRRKSKGKKAKKVKSTIKKARK